MAYPIRQKTILLIFDSEMSKNNNIKGNALWKELHEHALYHDGSYDRTFIIQFGRKIPRYMRGCSCNEFWNKWIKRNPPKYSVKNYEYFKWTVDCHNAVNRKLGKPTMSYEDALKHTKNNV